jgi:hypothetical protein
MHSKPIPGASSLAATEQDGAAPTLMCINVVLNGQID